MINNVTKRFIDCFIELKAKGKVKSDRQFCISLGYQPQSWTKVIKGERSVTLDLVRKATIIYKFNTAYIFTGVGEKFLQEENLNVLSIAIDEEKKERILHVPISAKAGYQDQFNDIVYLENLISYTLPGDYFNMGTYRSFEVEGDSMEPTLTQGEVIVCSYVDEPSLWQFNLKDSYVYVIVTKNDIVVKRVVNRIAEERCLELVSDNPTFPPRIVDIEDVIEIWIVKMKISPFAHSKISFRQEMTKKYSSLHDIIHGQSDMIERLNNTVEKLLNKQRTQL
jgi:hypothetical protein